MIKKILHYKGVYGENHQLFEENQIHIESLIIRSEVFKFEINEHLHSNLVQFFILEKGGGILSSEGTQISLQTPCVIFIPNGILHGFSWEPNISGTVITVASPMYAKLMSKSNHILAKFQNLNYLNFCDDKSGFEQSLLIVEQLKVEYNDILIDQNEAIGLLLKLLMIFLNRKMTENVPSNYKTHNRSLVYFNAFQKDLKNNINRSKSISDYANDLNITAVHLNRICNEIVQKSALKIIHEKIISESRKMLLFSDKTIEEIAYELNFKDASHFSKLFKQTVGMSPREFRKLENSGVTSAV